MLGILYNINLIVPPLFHNLLGSLWLLELRPNPHIMTSHTCVVNSFEISRLDLHYLPLGLWLENILLHFNFFNALYFFSSHGIAWSFGGKNGPIIILQLASTTPFSWPPSSSLSAQLKHCFLAKSFLPVRMKSDSALSCVHHGCLLSRHDIHYASGL